MAGGHAARMTGMLWTWYTPDRDDVGVLHTQEKAALVRNFCLLANEHHPFNEVDFFPLFPLSSYPFPSVKYPLGLHFIFIAVISFPVAWP